MATALLAQRALGAPARVALALALALLLASGWRREPVTEAPTRGERYRALALVLGDALLGAHALTVRAAFAGLGVLAAAALLRRGLALVLAAGLALLAVAALGFAPGSAGDGALSAAVLVVLCTVADAGDGLRAVVRGAWVLQCGLGLAALVLLGRGQGTAAAAATLFLCGLRGEALGPAVSRARLGASVLAGLGVWLAVLMQARAAPGLAASLWWR